MYERVEMLFIYTETPLHAGSGASLGIVDLPLQRERYTNLPMIQASGLKGKLRASTAEDEKTKLVFGPRNAAEHAGAFAPGDVRILLFPIRSLAGVFAWCTCPYVLNRFLRDAERATAWVNRPRLGIPSPASNKACIALGSDIQPPGGASIVLEEYAFETETDPNISNQVADIANWLAQNALPAIPSTGVDSYAFWRNKLYNGMTTNGVTTTQSSLVILPDDAFRDFTELSTQVISRTRIDQETKTVAKGALWTEEHLPADTLLYAPLFVSKPRVEETKRVANNLDTVEKVLNFVKQPNGASDLKQIQLGGDETIGRGIVSLRFSF